MSKNLINKINIDFNKGVDFQKQLDQLYNERVNLNKEVENYFYQLILNKVLSKINTSYFNIRTSNNRVTLSEKINCKDICFFENNFNQPKNQHNIIFKVNYFPFSILQKDPIFDSLQQILLILNDKTTKFLNLNLEKRYKKYIKKQKNNILKHHNIFSKYIKVKNNLSKTTYKLFLKKHIFEVKLEKFKEGLDLSDYPFIPIFPPPTHILRIKSIQLIDPSKGILQLKDIDNNVTTIKGEKYILDYFNKVIMKYLFAYKVII